MWGLHFEKSKIAERSNVPEKNKKSKENPSAVSMSGKMYGHWHQRTASIMLGVIFWNESQNLRRYHGIAKIFENKKGIDDRYICCNNVGENQALERMCKKKKR